MNIESLIEKIDLFDEMIVKSGFKRDVAAWVTALAHAETQSNLITMRDMAENTLRFLKAAESSGAKDGISILLPKSKTFADLNTQEELEELLADPEIEPSQFYARLNSILATLTRQLNSDASAVDSAREHLSVYLPTDRSYDDSEKAIVSVIFKDQPTITGLKHFSRTLHRWDQALLMYHKLLKSESPEEISLVEVQNGSIDVIINLDVSVTIEFLAALTVGYKAFNAYLKWKGKYEEIVEGYAGNTDLLELHSKEETLMLDNIERSIRKTVEEQHKAAKKKDKDISKESPTVKIDRISTLLAEHITKGNEVKLLSAPREEPQDGEATEDAVSDDLVAQARKATELKRLLSSEELKLLCERYSSPDEIDQNIDGTGN